MQASQGCLQSNHPLRYCPCSLMSLSPCAQSYVVKIIHDSYYNLVNEAGGGTNAWFLARCLRLMHLSNRNVVALTRMMWHRTTGQGGVAIVCKMPRVKYAVPKILSCLNCECTD